MPDFISREAALGVIRRAPKDHEYDMGTDYAYDAVEKLPAADVVPVVRCGDCAKATGLNRTDGWVRCGMHQEAMPPMRFCGYGTRKEATIARLTAELAAEKSRANAAEDFNRRLRGIVREKMCVGCAWESGGKICRQVTYSQCRLINEIRDAQEEMP